MKDLLDKFQDFTKTTAIYPEADIINSRKAMDYLSLALPDEAGEILGKLKKNIRDGTGELTDAFCEALSKEIGDVAYYISQICNTLELSMFDVHHKANAVLPSMLKDENIVINDIGRNIMSTSCMIMSYMNQFINDDTIPLDELKTSVGRALVGLIGESLIICHLINIKFEDIVKGNMDKLQSRKDRGVISGSGDDR